MERKEALNRVRTQGMLVRRLREQMRAMTRDGVRSPRLDAMPRGTGSGGLDVRMERQEAMERMLERESEVLQRYEREARKTMDGLRPELYAFCAMYYINGFSLEETARALDRCTRQCARYRREIEQAGTSENVPKCQLAQEREP